MIAFPFVPTAPSGKFRGTFVGTVEDNKDGAPDNPGFRIRVTIDVLGSGLRTFWARVVVPMGGNERGTYFLPQKGEQVLVVFEHGNMNRTPIVLGTMWSTQHKPAETNSSGENNTKQIQSPKGHRIIFDDKQGAEKITIVDSTGKNKIEIDSAAKKVTIQSAGDVEVVANKGDAVLHAKQLKVHAKGDLTKTAMTVALHAQGQMGLFGLCSVKGSTQINMDPTPACKIAPSPSGFLEGGSDSPSSSASQQDAAQQTAQGGPAAQPPQNVPGGPPINQPTTRQAGLPETAAAAIAGGVFLAGAAGMMSGAAGEAAMFGGQGGLPGAAGLSGLGGLSGGSAGGGAGGPAASVSPGAQADASGAPPSSAFASQDADAGAAGDAPDANRMAASPPRSDKPQWGTAQAGDVGHDVKGRATASASVSSSGVDVFTSSSSSVFQESAVSRATNPAQVPDLAVQVTSEADRLATAADPAKEASSHIPPLPLEPTPPVVEPRSAAASAAPASIRSGVETAGQVESGTSDARAQMKDPEQGAETAAQSVVNERISAAHPMGAKGEVNARESAYGDPNMLAKAEVDHQFDRGEAVSKVKVADENFTTGGSVSTEEDPDAPPVAKVSSGFGTTEPKQTGKKPPDSDPKKPGSK